MTRVLDIDKCARCRYGLEYASAKCYESQQSEAGFCVVKSTLYGDRKGSVWVSTLVVEVFDIEYVDVLK